MGLKDDASTIFHEMPTWGWWVGGLSAIGLYLYHARHHAQSASTLPGVPDALPTGGIPGAGGGSGGSGGGGNIQITVAQDPTTATALAKLAAELAAEKKLIEELQKQGHGHPPPPWHWHPPPHHGPPPGPPPPWHWHPPPHHGPPPQAIPGVPSAYLGEENGLRQDKISYYLAIGMPLPAQLRYGSPTGAFTPMPSPVAGQGYTLPHLSPLTAEQTAYLQQAAKKT